MKIRSTLISLVLTLISFPISADNGARYVFLFIGDGMGMGQISAAQGYVRVTQGQDSLLTMMKLPVASFATTHSASSPITDSAAAGTALSTGSKTKNGMLGMNPDTMEVVSIARILKDNGNYGVGLITTVAPDDATPGAFFAHVPRRNMFYEIGKQMAESGYEFIAGANLRGAKDSNGNPNDLLEHFKTNNVVVTRGLNDISDIASQRVLVLSPDSIMMNDVGYTIDSIPGALNLPDMTVAAINHLMKHSPERFFLMVEGGNIDHAGHANDPATIVIETVNFDQALAKALNFYNEHPDETLIVVTADHETGGLGMGNSTLGYWQRLDRLKYVTMSKDGFSEWSKKVFNPQNPYSWEQTKKALDEKMGLYRIFPVRENQDSILKEKFNNVLNHMDGDDRQSLYSSFNTFTEYVFNIISAQSGLGWTTGDHTGAVVPVFAIGKGAQLFNAPMDNTMIPVKILEATGIGR